MGLSNLLEVTVPEEQIVLAVSAPKISPGLGYFCFILLFIYFSAELL